MEVKSLGQKKSCESFGYLGTAGGTKRTWWIDSSCRDAADRLFPRTRLYIRLGQEAMAAVACHFPWTISRSSSSSWPITKMALR